MAVTWPNVFKTIEIETSQQHIMLECPHPLFTPIRHRTKNHQHRVASSLRPHLPLHLRTLVENVVHASWISGSPNLRRLWLGLWTPTLLKDMLPPMHDLHRPLSPNEITSLTNSISQLTLPLLDAYHEMLQTILQRRPYLGLLDPPCPQTSPPIHQVYSLHEQHPDTATRGLQDILTVDPQCYALANASLSTMVSPPHSTSPTISGSSNNT